MDSESYFVYVMSSEVANKFYVGMSADPQIRLKQHNAGHSQFTKGFRPWKLVHIELAGNRENARKLEKYYKTGVGRKHWKRILEDKSLNPNLNFLIIFRPCQVGVASSLSA